MTRRADRRARWLVLAAGTMGTLASCSTSAAVPALRARAAVDLACPAKEIELTELDLRLHGEGDEGDYAARGCGRVTRYAYHATTGVRRTARVSVDQPAPELR